MTLVNVILCILYVSIPAWDTPVFWHLKKGHFRKMNLLHDTGLNSTNGSATCVVARQHVSTAGARLGIPEAGAAVQRAVAANPVARGRCATGN